MKILLDENLPHTLRHRFPGRDVFTAVYMGFAGVKNGELLNAAESAGFARSGMPRGTAIYFS